MGIGSQPPERDQTDQEKKLEVLNYFHNGSWLADTLHKESTNPKIVNDHDHPAFFAEDNPSFHYPDASVLNEMIKAGLISVHVSACDGAVKKEALAGTALISTRQRPSGASGFRRAWA